MEEQNLLEPLIISTNTTTPAPAVAASTTDDKFTASISSITHRIVCVIFIAILSIWANYEASKGFEVTIINDAGDSPAGRRFALFFVSNDKATRIVLNTSHFAEQLLYPNASHPKKQVNRVTLRLAGRNLSQPVVVNESNDHEFVLHISPSVMEETNLEKVVVSAVQRGMARVWLWDGEIRAPTSLIDGMVEYVGRSAGFAAPTDSGGLNSPEPFDVDGSSCWENRDGLVVADFLNYCERVVPHGFIGRLNQAMRERWHVRMIDEALGLPAQQLCFSYYSSSARQIPNVMGPTSNSGPMLNKLWGPRK